MHCEWSKANWPHVKSLLVLPGTHIVTLGRAHVQWSLSMQGCSLQNSVYTKNLVQSTSKIQPKQQNFSQHQKVFKNMWWIKRIYNKISWFFFQAATVLHMLVKVILS